jgi:DNA adenine methylase
MKTLIKSPLRYPGGKSRAIPQIMPHLPLNLREYREPFVGGGSVFFAVCGLFKKQLSYVLNDLNRDLICFWKHAQQDVETLAETITTFRDHYLDDGRALHQFLTQEGNMRSDFDRAVRFFIMNRITFSGVMDAGGYSQQAFDKRFTLSSIERLRNIASSLVGVTIQHSDYEPLLFQEGKDVFIFLDPPYLSAADSKLYGVGGKLHTSFDHERFAANMRKCPHRWLITYDDSPEIRKLFSFADIIEWELQYGMNNFTNGSAAKGKELFIKNY